MEQQKKEDFSFKVWGKEEFQRNSLLFRFLNSSGEEQEKLRTEFNVDTLFRLSRSIHKSFFETIRRIDKLESRLNNLTKKVNNISPKIEKTNDRIDLLVCDADDIYNDLMELANSVNFTLPSCQDV